MKRMLSVLALFALLTSCQAQPGDKAQEKTQNEDSKDPSFSNVDVDQASTMIHDKEVIVLDVRTPREFEAGHLVDARAMNFYDEDFEQQLQDLPKDQPYLLYCQSGNRSGQTMLKMKELGFDEVYNLQGGITAWKNSGQSVTK
ncbi:MAG: rhodanese-like domain-containing protein [Owenweeksia sp.]|nr:rhodanese-like domain-containing protein [Owenweeksia sp.]